MRTLYINSVPFSSLDFVPLKKRYIKQAVHRLQAETSATKDKTFFPVSSETTTRKHSATQQRLHAPLMAESLSNTEENKDSKISSTTCNGTVLSTKDTLNDDTCSSICVDTATTDAPVVSLRTSPCMNDVTPKENLMCTSHVVPTESEVKPENLEGYTKVNMLENVEPGSHVAQMNIDLPVVAGTKRPPTDDLSEPDTKKHKLSTDAKETSIMESNPSGDKINVNLTSNTDHVQTMLPVVTTLTITSQQQQQQQQQQPLPSEPANASTHHQQQQPLLLEPVVVVSTEQQQQQQHLPSEPVNVFTEHQQSELLLNVSPSKQELTPTARRLSSSSSSLASPRTTIEGISEFETGEQPASVKRKVCTPFGFV